MHIKRGIVSVESVAETDDACVRIGVEDHVLGFKDRQVIEAAFNVPIQEECAHRKHHLNRYANQGGSGGQRGTRVWS